MLEADLNLLSPPPLQIFFQNAHEMCSLAMFSSDDSKQCVQNWSNMLYDVIRSMGLKSLIKVHYFKTDLIESGVGQSMSQWSWWKFPQPSSASMKM